MSAAKAAAYRLLSDAFKALADAEEDSADVIATDGFIDRRTCAQLGIGPEEFATAAKNGAFPLFAVNGKRFVARRADVIAWVMSNSAEKRRAELADRARSNASTKTERLLDAFGIAKPPTKHRKTA